MRWKISRLSSLFFGTQLAEITRHQKIITLSTSPYKCNSHTLLLRAVDTDDESPGCFVGLPQQGRSLHYVQCVCQNWESWWEAWQPPPPPQGNQDLLVVRDKVGRPSDELEVNRCLKCDIFCSFMCSMVGRQEGHPACKTFGVGLLMALIWLELCTTYSSSFYHHLHHP